MPKENLWPTDEEWAGPRKDQTIFTDNLNFKQAFKHYRQILGAGDVFKWRGGFFTTDYAHEVSSPPTGEGAKDTVSLGVAPVKSLPVRTGVVGKEVARKVVRSSRRNFIPEEATAMYETTSAPALNTLPVPEDVLEREGIGQAGMAAATGLAGLTASFAGAGLLGAAPGLVSKIPLLPGLGGVAGVARSVMGYGSPASGPQLNRFESTLQEAYSRVDPERLRQYLSVLRRFQTQAGIERKREGLSQLRYILGSE